MKTAQEVYAKHLTDFATEIKGVVTRMFENQSSISPIAFALVFKEDRAVIAVLDGLGEVFRMPNGKDMVAHIIKESSKELKPVALAFASEAWVSRRDGIDASLIVDEKGNFKPGMTPEEDPNRKEVVMLQIETFDKESLTYWPVVEKDSTRILEKANLSDDWRPKSNKSQGRFTNFLEENYSEMAETLRKQLSTNLN
jgi:hypothetical protein